MGLVPRLARVRKTVVTIIGMAVTLVLLVPQDAIPERWRPWVGVLLAVGTVAGVYSVRNQPPPRVAPTLFARERVGEHEQPRPPPRRRPRK